eukprot:3478294-Alexandrium_andersonii.AAC.1
MESTRQAASAFSIEAEVQMEVRPCHRGGLHKAQGGSLRPLCRCVGQAEVRLRLVAAEASGAHASTEACIGSSLSQTRRPGMREGQTQLAPSCAAE